MVKILNQTAAAVACFLAFAACDTITYIPRSKTNIRRQAPSILIMERIVDFRMEQNSWPVSIADMTSKGIKYHKAFQDFPYTDNEFKIIDSNTMIFYFNGHIIDKEDYKNSQKINLNNYNGRVRFFKHNDKFIWKMKMK